MKVLIIGGGIGGLALAGFLEREGAVEYCLVEKDPDWSRHGFTLGMWSNGRTMLAKLGLGDKFDKVIVPHHRMLIKTGSGRLLKSYNLSKFYVDYGLAYSHLHRRELHDWLLSKADPKKIKLKTVVNNISAEQDGLKVTFGDGSTERFDLVVGADGINSWVRAKYFGDHLEKYINWRTWYVRPREKLAGPHDAIEYLDPGCFIGLFDDGQKNLLVFCHQISHAIFDEERGRITRLKKMFTEPFVEKALQGLSDSEVLPTDLAEVKVNKWHKDGIVLIGDAAHGFEPFAGLGASMALEDAYILSEELCKISQDYDLSQALQNYERRRRPRVDRAAWLTKKMRAWSTIKSSFWRSVVNIFAPIIPEKYFIEDFIKLMDEQV